MPMTTQKLSSILYSNFYAFDFWEWYLAFGKLPSSCTSRDQNMLCIEVVAPPRQEFLGVVLIRYNNKLYIPMCLCSLYSDLFLFSFFRWMQWPFSHFCLYFKKLEVHWSRTEPDHIYISPWFPILLNCTCMLSFD